MKISTNQRPYTVFFFSRAETLPMIVVMQKGPLRGFINDVIL